MAVTTAADAMIGGGVARSRRSFTIAMAVATCFSHQVSSNFRSQLLLALGLSTTDLPGLF